MCSTVYHPSGETALSCVITLLAEFVPLLQVMFIALLEDFYLGRLAVKDRDKNLGSLA
jgi:hypothetical protein